jgi:hypothetical protein
MPKSDPPAKTAEVPLVLGPGRTTSIEEETHANFLEAGSTALAAARSTGGVQVPAVTAM